MGNGNASLLVFKLHLSDAIERCLDTYGPDYVMVSMEVREAHETLKEARAELMKEVDKAMSASPAGAFDLHNLAQPALPPRRPDPPVSADARLIAAAILLASDTFRAPPDAALAIRGLVYQALGLTEPARTATNPGGQC